MAIHSAIGSLTERIDGPTGRVVRTAVGRVTPTETGSTTTTLGLQEIVQPHSKLWEVVWSVSRMRLCCRTDRLEKRLERTSCAEGTSTLFILVLYSIL